MISQRLRSWIGYQPGGTASVPDATDVPTGGWRPMSVWALQGMLGLCTFFVIEPIFHSCSEFAPSLYTAPVLIVEALRYRRTWVVLAIAALMLVCWRRCRWDQFELGPQMRWLFLAMTLTLAFAFSTYSYNFFYDQPHYVGRGLLVVLSALTFVHPAFLPLFLLQAYVLVGQFNHPLAYSWTDKIRLFQLLTLGVAFVMLKPFWRRLSLVPYLIVGMSVIAAFYVVPGLGKLRLDWLATNHTVNIVDAAHFQNGWLSTAPQWYERVREFTAQSDWLLKLTTLVLEIGIIFALFRRWCAVALLVSCVGMHLGIFLTSGICFWKWMAVDLAFVAVILSLRQPLVSQIFNVRQVALSGAFALVIGAYSVRLVNLAWYDSNLSFRFEIHAIGESGRRYAMAPHMFAPYDLPFAQGRLYFVTSHPSLVDCLGSTHDRELLMRLRSAKQQEDVNELRQRFGQVMFDESRRQQLDMLLQRFFAWQNTGAPVASSPVGLKAPHHIVTTARLFDADEIYDGQEAVHRVEIRLKERLRAAHGEDLIVFDEVVHEVDVRPQGRDDSTMPLEETITTP